MTDPAVLDVEATEPGVDPEPPPVEAAPSTLPAMTGRPTHHGARVIGGTEVTIVPPGDELSALAQMAVTISAAATAPKALQGKPNDAFLVLLTARDLGVGLTTAVREFHVIDGRVTLSPKVKNAMVKQGGYGRTYPHQPPRPITLPDGSAGTQVCPCGHEGPANGDTSATWHAERNDEPGILHSSTFTIEMAQRVEAWENKAKITLATKSNWRQYPQRMLSWRALGYLLDDVFPEVGTGLYSPDEMGAVTDADGEPIIDVVGRAEPLRGTRAPSGHNTPPPPEASAEDRQAIMDRIDRLAVLDGARDALVELWTRTDGDRQALPPLDRLLASQIPRCKAMVSAIEARADAGEFGAWPEEGGEGTAPTGNEDPPPAPVSPAEDTPPTNDGDTPSNAADGESEAPAPPPEPTQAEAAEARTEYLAATQTMVDAEGAAWLVDRDDGNGPVCGFRDEAAAERYANAYRRRQWLDHPNETPDVRVVDASALEPDGSAEDPDAQVEGEPLPPADPTVESARVDEVIEQVKAMSLHEVREALAARDKSGNGTAPTLCARLCVAILADEGIHLTQGVVKGHDA